MITAIRLQFHETHVQIHACKITLQNVSESVQVD